MLLLLSAGVTVVLPVLAEKTPDHELVIEEEPRSSRTCHFEVAFERPLDKVTFAQY
jgi:hypothetical protein